VDSTGRNRYGPEGRDTVVDTVQVVHERFGVIRKLDVLERGIGENVDVGAGGVDGLVYGDGSVNAVVPAMADFGSGWYLLCAPYCRRHGFVRTVDGVDERVGYGR
jgi:hypothetical protein